MTPRIKLYESPEWMKFQYYRMHKTPEEIAELAHCSRITVYRKLKEFKILK